MSTIEVQGHCDQRFERVGDAFQANFDKGLDVGASFAVSLDGEMVVDLWGGHLDEMRRAQWQRDTIVNVYSTTKTMTALVALVLADRGELDLHAPVARYWPEFAQNGKQNVEVRHLLSHSAGLSGIDEPLAQEDLYDWEKVTSALAAQTPWWEPGTASGYHAMTQGYLVGEVVRRVSGKTLGTYFREEIAQPLNADFHIGLSPEHDHRVGDLIPPEQGEVAMSGDRDSLPSRTFANPRIDARQSRTEAWRRAEIPAANGHGNARSVVQVLTLLACGGRAQGHRLLSEAGCRRALEPQTQGNDLVLRFPLSFGMGFALNRREAPLGPNPNTMFWGGWGGSVVVIDMDARLTFAFVMNKMRASLMADERTSALADAVHGAVEY